MNIYSGIMSGAGSSVSTRRRAVVVVNVVVVDVVDVVVDVVVVVVVPLSTFVVGVASVALVRARLRVDIGVVVRFTRFALRDNNDDDDDDDATFVDLVDAVMTSMPGCSM